MDSKDQKDTLLRSSDKKNSEFPIKFEKDDFNLYSDENIGINKILQYLIEPLNLDIEDLEKKVDVKNLNAFLGANDSFIEKLGQTVYAFLLGGRKHTMILKNETEKEVIGNAYSTNKDQVIELVNRLHILNSINTDNKDTNRSVKYYAKSIIDHFTTSKTLLNNVSIDHLTPLIEQSRGKISQIKTFAKKSGDQMGSGLIFTYESNSEEKDDQEGKYPSLEKDIRFFVKTHQNFKLASTSAQRLAVSGERERIDYKELMIYKILENTRFGPKSSFCVHPFARGAVLIATQAANFTKTHLPQNKNFMEGSKFDAKDSELLESFNEKDHLDLNGIDLMARILNITDLNGDNFGRVTVSSSDKETSEFDKNKWKIIDFRILDSRDISSSIYGDFIRTNNNKTFITGFVEKIVANREQQEKQQMAEKLVKILDGDKQSFEKGVVNARESMNEFLNDPKNRLYLRLSDDKVKEIKNDLDSYIKVINTNYQSFKGSVEEKSNQNQR